MIFHHYVTIKNLLDFLINNFISMLIKQTKNFVLLFVFFVKITKTLKNILRDAIVLEIHSYTRTFSCDNIRLIVYKVTWVLFNGLSCFFDRFIVEAAFLVNEVLRYPRSVR